MSPETGLGGPGARAEPDLVRLHLTDSALVIAPGGGELREDLVRPALPVDGGEIVCDPGIADPAGAGRMSARLLDGRVPEWVGLIYGPEVARAAGQMLDRTARPESDGAVGLTQTVHSTWFTRPSRAAWIFLRLAQGLWIRRYWPSPADGSALAIDPFLLDLELGALMRMEPVPVCFGSDAMESLVYGPHRDRIRGAAEHLRDHGAEDILVRKLHVLLRRALSWLIERIEDDEGDEDNDGDDGDGPGAGDEIDALWALYDDLGGLPRAVKQFYFAPVMREPRARRACVQPEDVWEGGSLVRHGTDALDWSQNFCGLLATDNDAVRWVVAPVRDGGFRLDVSVTVADRIAHDIDGARALARVPIPGFLPVLVELRPDEAGARLTGWAAVTADEMRAIDVVDVVSVPGARAPLRGPARERMRELQDGATRWARRRSRSVRQQVEAPDVQSWDLLVPRTIPAGLDLSMPWAAEVAAAQGIVMRP